MDAENHERDKAMPARSKAETVAKTARDLEAQVSFNDADSENVLSRARNAPMGANRPLPPFPRRNPTAMRKIVLYK